MKEKTKQALEEIKSLRFLRKYWLREEEDNNGVSGWVLKVYHGLLGKIYSDVWASTEKEDLLPLVEYLESKGVKSNN